MPQIREQEFTPNPINRFYKNNINTSIQEPDMIFEPDEDFYRSISMDEFIERALVRLEKIDKMYAKK